MGHQAFSDMCWIYADRGGIAGVGEAYGVWDAFLFEPLAVNGCQFHDPRFFAPAKNWRLVKYATAAALEETLACDARMAPKLAAVASAFDFVAEYRARLQ